jgi:hypothetical protein
MAYGDMENRGYSLTDDMYNTVLSEDTIDSWIKKVQSWDPNVWVRGRGDWLIVKERVNTGFKKKLLMEIRTDHENEKYRKCRKFHKMTSSSVIKMYVLC